MHYYQFNIADYRKDTQHLTPIEHYIYRELMDWYYLDEAPIVNDPLKITRRLRLGSENETQLVLVLEEFFMLTEQGWSHGRVEQEIWQYRARSENARVNGSKGGRPPKARKTQSVNLANPDLTQTKANHKPITNNQYKEICGANAPPAKKKRKVFSPPEPVQVAEYLREKGNTTIDPVHFVDFYATRGWKLSSGTKMADWKAAVRTWINREGKNNGQNRPTGNPATPGRKPTPAERVEIARQAAYQRELTRESPAVGAVEAHGGNVRPLLGEPAR